MSNKWLFSVGLDCNPFAGEPDPGMFGGELITGRFNINSRAAIDRMVRWSLYGHSAYCLYGHEVDDMHDPKYSYSETGLRAFLTDYAQFITCLTNRNEWDVEPNIERARFENEWAHRVCKEHGVPFAISSTLVQDWHGDITGLGGPGQWPGLANLYRPGEVDGELIDLHLYSYGNGHNLSRMLAQYRAMGYQEPTIVGEFGTRIGDDIPVREMFHAVLNPAHRVASAMLFCLQDFDDPDKRFGLLRTDGSRKDAFDAFVQVARERQDQKYYLGVNPVPTPTPTPKQVFYPGHAFDTFAREHPELSLVATSQETYRPERDTDGVTYDVVTQRARANGVPVTLEYDSRTGEVYFPFAAAS